MSHRSSLGWGPAVLLTLDDANAAVWFHESELHVGDIQDTWLAHLAHQFLPRDELPAQVPIQEAAISDQGQGRRLQEPHQAWKAKTQPVQHEAPKEQGDD